MADLQKLIRPTPFRFADWRRNLSQAAQVSGSRLDRVFHQTDESPLAEGIYVKIEQDDWVEDRFKFVRQGFTQAIASSDSHWRDRPLLANGLRADADIFAWPPDLDET